MIYISLNKLVDKLISTGNTYVYDPLTTLKNGWVSTALIWNQRSRDPDDLRGGYALYALG
ncbi:MAG: hypothetical protein IJF92_01900 [Bacilli bacterium]|nr:hypothetical protein [Bacilli bacterium]